MKLGIVILNYNTYQITENLVKKCVEMQLFSYIVVVDNNSAEDASGVIRLSDNVVFLRQDVNKGYAAGNNVGFRFLKGKEVDIAFLANPDVFFDKTTIMNISAFLSANNEYAVVSSIRGDNSYGDNALQFWNRPNYKECLLESFYLYRRLNYEKRRKKSIIKVNGCSANYLDVEVVPGAFFGAKLCVLDKLNYLDESTFLWYEENCLSAKVYKNGYKEAILTNCYYYHKHGSKVHGNNLFPIYNASKEYYCNSYLSVSDVMKMFLKIMDAYSNFEQKCLNIIGKNIKRNLYKGEGENETTNQKSN